MDDQQKINYQPSNEQPQVVQPQWQYQSGQLQPLQNSAPSLAPQPQQPPLQPQSLQPQPQSEQQSIEQPQASDDGSLVSWSASEFIAHEKANNWYVVLAVLAGLSAVIIYVITREVFSVVVVVVMAIAVAVYGGIKPRTLRYAIYPEGIKVGEKLYLYQVFRSFSVMDDTQIPSIQFLPQKRFMVPISVFCAAADIDAIVSILGEFLPYEHKERDTIDKLSSRFRF